MYKELTAIGTRLPFIEAWRREERKRAEAESGGKGEGEKVVKKLKLGEGKNGNLVSRTGEGDRPGTKRMRDSHHRVVSFPSSGFGVSVFFEAMGSEGVRRGMKDKEGERKMRRREENEKGERRDQEGGGSRDSQSFSSPTSHQNLIPFITSWFYRSDVSLGCKCQM